MSKFVKGTTRKDTGGHVAMQVEPGKKKQKKKPNPEPLTIYDSLSPHPAS